MAENPISLNLAIIVHRLLTSPRGWRVSHLQEELGIAPRTYRKYRRLLQDEFRPFLRRDGTSAVIEVQDGDERYLRLRPPRVIGSSDPELERLTAAVHFARSFLEATGDRTLSKGAEMLVSDFHASLRDREFLLQGVLSNAERMFVVRGDGVRASNGIVDTLVHAITNRRRVAVTFSDGEGLRIYAPLTLILEGASLYCVLQTPDEEEDFEVDVTTIATVEILAQTFEYPTRHRHEPER